MVRRSKKEKIVSCDSGQQTLNKWLVKTPVKQTKEQDVSPKLKNINGLPKMRNNNKKNCSEEKLPILKSPYLLRRTRDTLTRKSTVDYKDLPKKKGKTNLTEQYENRMPSSNDSIIQLKDSYKEQNKRKSTKRQSNTASSDEHLLPIRKSPRLSKSNESTSASKSETQDKGSPVHKTKSNLGKTKRPKQTGKLDVIVDSAHENIVRHKNSPKRLNKKKGTTQRLVATSGSFNNCTQALEHGNKHKEKSLKKLVQESIRKRTSKATSLPQRKKTKTISFNSASNDDLPTFKQKVPRKRTRETETFKKYGVIVPLIDEIIADQRHLSNYKILVEKARTLEEPFFKIPDSPKKVKVDQRPLDCKHLNLQCIHQHFDDNVSYLADIISGKKFSERHQRYIDKKGMLDNITSNSLTYSTSTIIFNFEQLDYMASLMRNQFDPEDVRTSYFFKVLMPELCLKIFMDTYNMNKKEATDYLDNRPVEWKE